MVVRVVLSLALAVFAMPLFAQVQPEEIDGGTPKYVREETPEERRERVGEVDPGPNPDLKKVFHRKGKDWMIERFDRRWAAFDVPEGYVRPMANINFAFELYQMNDKYVWAWMPTVDELKKAAQEPTKKREHYSAEQIAYLKKLRDEFTELTPPSVETTVRFEESSEGLPSSGSWRHSAALADMNGDGHIDIIAPPERGTRSIRPVIFLGDGNGTWKPWEAAHWPYPMDYGTVVAGDFNGDNRPDLALGMHLTGPRVVLNNGDGKFIDASNGMTEAFPTRRVAAADVDRDGDLDLLAIYEGPSPGKSLKGARVRAYINEGKASKWRMIDASDANHRLGGDWLAVGRFNNDRYPDFVAASNMFHGVDIVHRSTGAAKWESVQSKDHFLVPFYSFYSAVATAPLTSKTIDDAVVSYQRMWPDQTDGLVDKPAIEGVVGVDRISFGKGGPTRTSLMRFAGSRPVTGLGTADFDGDGKLDLLFTRYEPREAVLLLGDGKGGFRRADLEGLQLMDNPNYDITVGDVNGDKRPDVIVLFESTAERAFGNQNGAVKVFLNRGVAGSEAVLTSR
jgi:hypothetical protein